MNSHKNTWLIPFHGYIIQMNSLFILNRYLSRISKETELVKRTILAKRGSFNGKYQTMESIKIY